MNRSAIPDWVPFSVAADLDASELAPASADAVRERQILEQGLGVHVAAYRRGAIGKPQGLCVLYASADLSQSELDQIHAAEQRHPELLFVAYRNPLQR